MIPVVAVDLNSSSYLLKPEYFVFEAALHVFKLSVHDEIKLSKLFYSPDSYTFDILSLILVCLFK